MHENKLSYRRHMHNTYIHTFVMQSFISYVIHMRPYVIYICIHIRCILMCILVEYIGLYICIGVRGGLWYTTEFCTPIDTYTRIKAYTPIYDTTTANTKNKHYLKS